MIPGRSPAADAELTGRGRRGHAAGMTLKSLCVFAVLLPGLALSAAERVKLNAFERSQGWRLLFDGVDVSDWRGYRGEKLPANWRVQDGSLFGTAGDALVSAEDYADFELTFDWRVEAGGHGEIYFRVTEDESVPENSGPVMQLAGHSETLAGNGFVPPDRALTPQFGIWYRGKIVVFGNQVEHWLNGERVLRYMLDTPDWRKAVAASRFAAFAEYGTLRRGRVALAGERVEFRNIKVRPL